MFGKGDCTASHDTPHFEKCRAAPTKIKLGRRHAGGPPATTAPHPCRDRGATPRAPRPTGRKRDANSKAARRLERRGEERRKETQRRDPNPKNAQTTTGKNGKGKTVCRMRYFSLSFVCLVVLLSFNHYRSRDYDKPYRKMTFTTLDYPTNDVLQDYRRETVKDSRKQFGFRFEDANKLFNGKSVPPPPRHNILKDYDCDADFKKQFSDSFSNGLPENIKAFVNKLDHKGQPVAKSLGSLDMFAYRYFFYESKPRTFVEIGAFDGIDQSNTVFYEKYEDWNGVLIEGNLENYVNLKKNRCRSKNVKCVHAAVCKSPTFLYMNGGGIMASGSEQGYGDAAICLPFHEILLAAGVHHVDFLSLDVEGAEFNLLSGHNFDAVPIDVIVMETMANDEDLYVNAAKRWALDARGYCRFELDVGQYEVLNEVWVHAELGKIKNRLPK